MCAFCEKMIAIPWNGHERGTDRKVVQKCIKQSNSAHVYLSISRCTLHSNDSNKMQTAGSVNHVARRVLLNINSEMSPLGSQYFWIAHPTDDSISSSSLLLEWNETQQTDTQSLNCRNARENGWIIRRNCTQRTGKKEHKEGRMRQERHKGANWTKEQGIKNGNMHKK